MDFCNWAPGKWARRCPPCFRYWREFAARYVTALCTRPSATPTRTDDLARGPVAPPADAELEWLAMAAPLMTGAEYLTGAVLRALWRETDKALRVELSEARCGVQEFLKQRNPAWNLVGRVLFNLAENRSDAESPFAFLATYTARLSAHAKAQHLPLGQALREYAGRGQQGSPALAAAAGAARRGELRVAEGHGRRGRDLSPAALDAR